MFRSMGNVSAMLFAGGYCAGAFGLQGYSRTVSRPPAEMYVMNGDKVATGMTAQFVPVNGGKAARISTSVDRGHAPDDFVSPAFRSRGLTLALVRRGDRRADEPANRANGGQPGGLRQAVRANDGR